MQTELKPCPFCGGDNIEYVDAKVIYGKDHAYCHSCKVEVPVYIWNRRTTIAPEEKRTEFTAVGWWNGKTAVWESGKEPVYGDLLFRPVPSLPQSDTHD